MAANQSVQGQLPPHPSSPATVAASAPRGAGDLDRDPALSQRGRAAAWDAAASLAHLSP
jgi:hypothetical protein